MGGLGLVRGGATLGAGAGQLRRAPAVKPRQARAAKPAERLCQGWGLGLMPGCSAGSSGALANFLWRLLGQAMMSDARALGGLRFRLENTRACLASPFPGCGSGAAKISRGGAGSGWARGLGLLFCLHPNPNATEALTARSLCAQGRVRTKTTKRSARIIVEKYYSRLTVDFQVNKRVCEEIALIPTKRLRNKIAGYITVRTPTLAPPPPAFLIVIWPRRSR